MTNQICLLSFMYYCKVYERFNPFLKYIIKFYWVSVRLTRVGLHVRIIFLGFIKFLIIVFFKSKFCGSISIGRTSIYEEHKPNFIIYGHWVYWFNRRSGLSIKTLSIS